MENNNNSEFLIFDLEDILGRPIKYYDYLGLERAGQIAYVEPYLGNKVQDDTNDKRVVWIYIADEDPEENVNSYVYQIASGEKKEFMYATIRLSTEVFLDM